jgi:tetratricopeptide (TPR) repeat protein
VVVVLWVAGLTLVAAPVSAQPRPDARSSKKAPDPDELKARALFKEGQTSYDVGEFKHALELYTEAYKVKPLPGFLFNIAQCHRQLGDYKMASFFFGRFIDNSSTESPVVAQARELLEDMNRRQADAERAAEKPKSDAPLATTLEPTAVKEPLLPPPPPPVEETPVYKKGWFWGVVGGAVVVVAGGITAGVLLSQPKTVPYIPAMTTLPDIDARTK